LIQLNFLHFIVFFVVVVIAVLTLPFPSLLHHELTTKGPHEMCCNSAA
jgi:hypothetical protein